MIDNDEFFFVGTPTVMHSGLRPHFARIHVDLRQQGFFSLAARLARDGHLWVDTTWMRELSELVKTIIVLRIACEGEHLDGSSVASKGSKGHPSAPVQLRLRPSTFAVATDTTTGEPEVLLFSCLKVKAPLREAQFWARVDRSSRNRTCPSWLVTAPRYLCMHILWYANQTFSNSYLAKTPSPPLFVGNTDLKKFRKLRTTP